jgi:hypothetical protein
LIGINSMARRGRLCRGLGTHGPSSGRPRSRHRRRFDSVPPQPSHARVSLSSNAQEPAEVTIVDHGCPHPRLDKARDKPPEETWELTQYGAEVIQIASAAGPGNGRGCFQTRTLTGLSAPPPPIEKRRGRRPDLDAPRGRGRNRYAANAVAALTATPSTTRGSASILRSTSRPSSAARVIRTFLTLL